MIRQYKQAPIDLNELPVKQQKTAMVATSTLVTLKTKEAPKDPKCSKAVAARPKALALPAQQSAATTNESHEDDDELMKVLDSTP